MTFIVLAGPPPTPEHLDALIVACVAAAMEAQEAPVITGDIL